MKRLDGSTGMREGVNELQQQDTKILAVWQYWRSVSSGFPDLSRFSAIGRHIPSITLPPDRPLRLMLILLSAGLAGSCTEVSSKVGIPIYVTPISKIVQHPRVGSSVNIKGTVTQQAPFLKGGAYQLQDETGKIWVIRDTPKKSPRPLPKSGDLLTIKGKVQYESIPVGQKEFGEVYIDEQKQLE